MGRGGAIPITGVLPFLSFLSLTLSKRLFTGNLLSKIVAPISRFFEIGFFPKMEKYWAVPPTVDTLKHEKIIDDNRDSISLLRSGSSDGANRPRIYMTKGVKMDLDTLRGDFEKKHNAPPGSGVYANPNAYLNDRTWRNIALALCDGISMMPVVRDYPDCWIVTTLDGFASHLDPAALLIFSKHKIILVKE